MTYDLTIHRRRSVIATIGYLVASLLIGLLSLWELWAYGELLPRGTPRYPPGIDPLGELPLGLSIATMIAGIWIVVAFVFNGVWLYRASANARDIEPVTGRIGPGWAVGWYFIPVANLWMPFRAMKQLWLSTFRPGDIRAPAPGILWVWWLAWIVSGILDNVSVRQSFSEHDHSGYLRSLWLDAASTPLSIVSGAIFLMIVIRVSDAQIAARAGASVFD